MEMELFESNTLDEAINFNTDNIFEHLETLLSEGNAELIGAQATETVKKLCAYIEDLQQPQDVLFEVEDFTTQALTQVSKYAYSAGFREACRLIKTLNSF